MRRRALALAGVLGFLALVHGLPHVPGDVPDSPAAAYPELARRAVDAAAGDDHPYPLHVDEHYHMARMAQIDRQAKVEIDDPYTGEPAGSGLFTTVSGFRTERGFDLAVAQVAQLTGADLAALFRFVPALWSAYLGLTLWLVLRPAPGALAAAAFTAMLPTTVRFLGVGFLVPSAFALPWILATLHVALHGRGGGRFFGLVLLITGAHFMHLVIGVLCIVTGLLAMMLRGGALRDRLAVAAGVLLPLLWIVPAAREDIVAAVSSEHTLPFAQDVFLVPGMLVYTLVVAGALAAVMRGDAATRPHRVLLALAVLLAASMAVSIALGHRNDATYSRVVHAFFLALAALAGLGLAVAVRTAARLAPERSRRPVAAAAVAAVAAVALAFPVQALLAEPYYHVFDEPSWRRVQAFAASPAGPDDTFLAHPWQAPVLTAVSGARPYAVLYPGAPPLNGEDYTHYLATEGADADWLADREIAYVVAPVEPGAEHAVLAAGVYKIAAVTPEITPFPLETSETP